MTSKLGNITKACSITDNIFNELVKNISNFKTELDIDKFIKSLARKNKVRIAFPPIAATDKNAANPHHKPNKTKLKGFTVIDLGVKVNDYCSDMSRTVFFGKPNKNQIKVYNLLLKSQNRAIKSIKINKRYFDIDKTCRGSLGKYKKYFIHGLGHGVSKKIHCKPFITSVFKQKSLSKKREKLIEEIKNSRVKVDDIVTIEPGIYIKNKFGIRIEDTIVVKKNKVEILTKSSKKLIIF